MQGGHEELGRAVNNCLEAGGRHCDHVVDAISELDFTNPDRDAALDRLAAAGAVSPNASETLVRIIYRERFVRAEIRKVLIDDVSAAEEALQETALAMVRALPTFRSESTFRTWVTAIARNKSIAVLRRTTPSAELLESDGEVARFSSKLASRADLEQAMSNLPDHFRQAVQLRDIEQRSYEEIAAILGIELNTVRSRLARGRAKLTAMFAEELSDEELRDQR